MDPERPSGEAPEAGAPLPPLPFKVEDLLARLRAREEFEAFARRAEEEMDLVEGALLVASEEHPHLDSAAYRRRVGAMAEAVRRRAAPGAPHAALLAALNEVLFQEEGFRGDRETYYDPRNSLLDQVIDRRLGIPITLSILHIAIGRQIGLPLHGVSFPGHFLVLCRGPEGEFLIDAFEGGLRVSVEEARERLRRIQGPEAGLDPGLFEPAGPRQILYRLLNNLKNIFMRVHEPGRALGCVERMLALAPGSATDLRDRGVLLLHLDFPDLARRDLERYLLEQPGTGDAGSVFDRLKSLHSRNRETS